MCKCDVLGEEEGRWAGAERLKTTRSDIVRTFILSEMEVSGGI